MGIKGIKEQILEASTAAILATREGMEETRRKTFSLYIEKLIEAKKADINPECADLPLLIENLRISNKVAIGAKEDVTAEGGIVLSLFTFAAGYSKMEQVAMELDVEMEAKTGGAVRLDLANDMSIEKLETLLAINNGTNE